MNATLEKWKRKAREANARGDEKNLTAIIEILEVLFGNDDHAALRFYTELEQVSHVRVS